MSDALAPRRHPRFVLIRRERLPQTWPQWFLGALLVGVWGLEAVAWVYFASLLFR